MQGGGGGNMMKQLQQMQSRMAKLQEELGAITLEGTSGGGAVVVTVDGHQTIKSLVIDPDAMAEGAEMLADLVLVAVNDALEKARKRAADHMGQLATGLGLPPGMI